jgi:TPR repeat protein
VEQDYGEAYRYFLLAAGQGHADGMFAVGECYYLGTGVDKDLETAAEWYQKALDAGFEPIDEEEAEHLKALLPDWVSGASEESSTETEPSEASLLQIQ